VTAHSVSPSPFWCFPLRYPALSRSLVRLMAGVPVFAITFTMLAYIWYTQYRFYRRFDVEDGRTVVLNMALLFVVLIYVYPLKFMFSTLILQRPESAFEARGLYVIYGIGFFAVFLLIGLLYRNGLHQADRLQLTRFERVMTRGWIEGSMARRVGWSHLRAAGVGRARYPPLAPRRVVLLDLGGADGHRIAQAAPTAHRRPAAVIARDRDPWNQAAR
jgi:hypothetical protein